ncbi:endonuclease domain-containing protein [Rhodococcus sp. ACS1]|uniref:endonuclease domain-containing protein n=1 Tax=Rhodococcus sp. ACS1 TaxID=2028570 RepID=UPI00211CFD64|nr:endonuclease domain-containing protein [Rhodococcus sp. ACS1]
MGPYVGDFVDERARIVVEVDGREFHSEPDVFRGDRRRQNWLVREGWMVLRFAAYDVLAHPDAIADEIIAAVRRRRRSRRRK